VYFRVPRASIAHPIVLSLLGATLLDGAGCRETPKGKTASTQSCRVEGRRRTERFIRKHKPRYLRARDRAIAYLGTFSIDPIALRKQGVKGKKKLVELLDAYVALHRHADQSAKGRLRARFRQAVAVTSRPDYHDLATADEGQLRQDATSYLRACYLMEKMDLDTAGYRKQIRAIKARLDAHMPGRGSHQRMVFRWYYDHFGLEVPPVLEDPTRGSVLRRRPNPYLLTVRQAYQLTHEVFVPFDYGGRLETNAFDAKERAYLRRALEVQTTIQIGRRNADLVGELLACIRFLGHTDLTVYRDGLSFVLSSQRPNGAFGDYEKLRPSRGDQLELGLYLHTTSVVMDILPLAFEGPPIRLRGR